MQCDERADNIKGRLLHKNVSNLTLRTHNSQNPALSRVEFGSWNRISLLKGAKALHRNGTKH